MAATLSAKYPCCGKPCRIKVVDGVPRWTLDRTHFCEPDEETGTTYRISVRVQPLGGLTLWHVTFEDLADDDAYHRYGERRVPRRKVGGHEKVLASIRGGNTTVKKIARDLAVSTSTARKYADELTERGWLTRREASEGRGRITVRFTAYWLTQRGQEAYEAGERF